MVRTPRLHYDHIFKVVSKAFPEIGYVYQLVVDGHRDLSDDELRAGMCSQLMTQLEGAPKFLAYQMMLYDRFGQNSYVVGPRVQDLFRRTELSKVLPEMVIEPQTAFYVALPECPWRIWGGDRTQWHNVEGVYVSFTDSVDGDNVYGDASGAPLSAKRERGIHILLWGGTNERSTGPADDAVLWFNINIDRWVREGDDLESFFANHSVMLADHKNTDRWKGTDPLDPFATPLIPDTPENLTEQRETLVNVMRLVLNLCLYMGSEDPNLEVVDNADEAERIKAQIKRKKAGGKRKKLERRLQNLTRTRIVYVGPLFERLEEERERRGQSRETGGTHATPIEHAVRPHWQHYWVGSGDDRRRIWRHKGMYIRGTGKPDRTITKIRE